MKDKNLEREILALLDELELKIDAISDTPRRHDMSAGVVHLRKLAKLKPNRGYE